MCAVCVEAWEWTAFCVRHVAWCQRNPAFSSLGSLNEFESGAYVTCVSAQSRDQVTQQYHHRAALAEGGHTPTPPYRSVYGGRMWPWHVCTLIGSLGIVAFPVIAQSARFCTAQPRVFSQCIWLTDSLHLLPDARAEAAEQWWWVTSREGRESLVCHVSPREQSRFIRLNSFLHNTYKQKHHSSPLLWMCFSLRRLN